MLIDVVVSYPKQLSSQNVVLACQIMYHVKCLIWNIRWPPVIGHVYRSDIMLCLSWFIMPINYTHIYPSLSLISIN